jgi:hypothetical protein
LRSFFRFAWAEQWLHLLSEVKKKERPCRNRRLILTLPTQLLSDSKLTVYDEEHIITYLRLLDADAAGADSRKITRIVLHIDPEREPDRARQAFESHLSRAKWMTEHGYRLLLRGGASA